MNRRFNPEAQTGEHTQVCDIEIQDPSVIQGNQAIMDAEKSISTKVREPHQSNIVLLGSCSLVQRYYRRGYKFQLEL